MFHVFIGSIVQGSLNLIFVFSLVKERILKSFIKWPFIVHGCQNILSFWFIILSRLVARHASSFLFSTYRSWKLELKNIHKIIRKARLYTSPISVLPKQTNILRLYLWRTFYFIIVWTYLYNFINLWRKEDGEAKIIKNYKNYLIILV